MEEFIAFDEITKPDKRHVAIGHLTGNYYSLKLLYKEIEKIILRDNVSETIISQFNITKNLAVYSWFSYSLAPVVDLRTYINIEHALKLSLNISDDKHVPFMQLIKTAVENKLILDSGFRHINVGKDSQEYSKKLIRTLPKLRNEAAHGSKILDFDCVLSLSIAADFINQLYENNI